MVRRKHVDYLRRMKRMVDSGNMDPWLTYNILQEVPPQPLPKGNKHPEKLIFPEDKLIKTFYDRYPMERLEPITLNSYDPPLPRKFVWKQMYFMETSKMPEEEAFMQTEKYYNMANRQTQDGGLKSTLSLVQKDEERVLRKALETARARRLRVE